MACHWLHATAALCALLLLLAVPPRPLLAQTDGSLANDFRALLSALDAVQTQLDAGDVTRARPFYDVFESVWFSIEDNVRNRWGPGYQSIADAMRSLRDALTRTPPDVARARIALAELRGTINGFQARVGAAGDTTGSAGATAAAPTSSTSSTGAGDRSSEADCARYSAQAAIPYFNYALGLAGGAPLPGIPPAQAMVPLYSFGPGPVPGTVAGGPFGAVLPYFPSAGPGAGPGGAGAALGTPMLSSGAMYAGLVTGNQLSPFHSAVPGPIAQSDVAALASQQSSEIAGRISLGSVQQSVVTNQFNASDLREGWVGAYVGLAGRARELALSLCGRIP